MEQKRIAVICSDSIRDGLIMMVASHRLSNEGARVITFHNHLPKISDWFPSHTFAYLPRACDIAMTFSSFDLLIVQYDGSPYSREVISYFQNDKKPILSIFYPLYSKLRHPSLTPWDRVFNKHLSLVDNISFAIASLLQTHQHSKNNGLCPPGNLSHRKYKRRVAIATSKYFPLKYEKIQKGIETLGFDTILVDPNDLSAGTKIIYESGYFIGPESGLCHLASNLQIPTLVVTGTKNMLSLWKPGWLKGSFITPPKWIPLVKERFIKPAKILSAFKKLAERDKIFL